MTKTIRASEQLAEAIATLQSLTNDDLRQRWAEIFRSPPPKHISRDLLLRGIAYRIQEKALGGLKPATKRRLLKLAEQRQAGDRPQGPTAQRVNPGTRMLREWQGETHSVVVTEEGFDYRGRTYRSLSKIAREITGARWSGPRFFGLRGDHQTMGVQHAD